MANGIAYVGAAIDAGLDVDAVAERMSFFWNAHNNLFEEVAKFRAARRMWARIMTDRFAAKSERSKLLRFHTQTGGSTLTAQQPENNVVRVTLQALAAVLGGTQSLHTNGYDEALGLPTMQAANLALRTQQIIAAESGVTDTVDPLAGSFYVESLTDEIEKAAWQYIDKIDSMGGAVAAIESGFMQDQITQAAYDFTLPSIAKTRSSSASTSTSRTPASHQTSSRSTPSPSAARSSAPNKSERTGTNPPSTPPSRSSPTPHAEPRTSSTR